MHRLNRGWHVMEISHASAVRTEKKASVLPDEAEKQQLRRHHMCSRLESGAGNTLLSNTTLIKYAAPLGRLRVFLALTAKEHSLLNTCRQL